MTAIEIVKVICPKLASDLSLQAYVQMAKDSLDCRFFGSQYPYAVAYKACHLYTLFGASGESGGGSDIEGTLAGLGAGDITSVKEGDLSITFASGSNEGTKANDLLNTKYGRMLYDLIKRMPTMGVNTSPLHFG